MKRALLTFAISFLSAIPASAQAYFITGNDLHQLCQSGRYGNAMSYVTGVLDGMELAAFLGANDQLFCLPNAITRGQTVDLVCQRLQEQPAYRHLAAAMHVSSAMAEAYPCR